MRRVLVIGISGAGKSTFSAALAEKTSLPLIHLDKEFWQPGWEITPRALWRERVSELVAREAWIMDGNYDSSLDLRLPRADTVCLFDYSAPRCILRVLGRVLSSHRRVRSDMAAGCPERFDFAFLKFVWRFNAVQRPRMLAALQQDGQHARTVIFRRDADARRFLDNAGP
jgi:adenylate kinase family enzyme